MANSKISALTSATTPLAGTETLPIVQSSTTKQVSVANLTAGRAVSTGALTSDSITTQTDVSGLVTLGRFSAGYPWVLVRPNSTATGIEIRDNAGNAQLVITQATGNVTVSLGNLVIGTSGKGIDFSATPGTGTSELLADYEEGNWTPIDSSGAGLTLSVTSAIYTKIGRQVTCWANLSYPATASGAVAVIGGLPFTSNAAFGGGAIQGYFSGRTFTITSSGLYGGSSATTMNIDKNNGTAVATNLDLSASGMYFVVNYTV